MASRSFRHPRLTIFDCRGCEGFECAQRATFMTFAEQNEENLQQWWANHVEQHACCPKPDLYVEVRGQHIGKQRCKHCRRVLPKYCTPFFRGVKLPLNILLGILYGMIDGQDQNQMMRSLRSLIVCSFLFLFSFRLVAERSLAEPRRKSREALGL